MKKDIRECKIQVRLTKEEDLKIKRIAHEAGAKNVSEFIREVIINKRFDVYIHNTNATDMYEALMEAVTQIARIGRNINQGVTRLEVKYMDTDSQINELVQELVASNKKVNDKAGQIRAMATQILNEVKANRNGNKNIESR